jgi:hypothetical protein
MMIGAHVGGIAKEDLGFFALCKGSDLRVFLLEPLLDQSLVAFLGALRSVVREYRARSGLDRRPVRRLPAHRHRADDRVLYLGD